ncbi:MAG: FG-GAP-like repeat-containing protein, partial [Candidatus Eisenbacteria bacterium]
APAEVADLSLVDLDGDHDLDLVVCSRNGGPADGLRLLLNDGVGGFSLHQFLPIAGARVARGADLDHAGWLEVVVLSGVSNTSFLQDAQGDASGNYSLTNTNNLACTFSAAVRPVAGRFGPTDVIGFAGLGIVSGAAIDEVITVSRLASLGMRRTLFPLVSGAANATSLLMADVDRDGALDALLRYNTAPAVADEFLGDPVQGFRAVPQVDLTTTLAWSAEIGDLDMDGFSDLLVSTINASTLQFFKGNGAGRFLSAGSLPGRRFTRSIAIADLNGDFAPDLVTASDSGTVATRVLGIRLNLAPSRLAAPPSAPQWSWSASPNPAHGRFALRLTLPADERDLEIDIHDVAGRHVRSLHHGALAAGTHRFDWDSRSEGLPGAPGVYLASVRGSNGVQTVRMVKF